MEMTTKFGINDSVYSIGRKQNQVTHTCTACGGTGSYTLGDDKKRTCPGCYGRRTKTTFGTEKWAVIGVVTIGQVRAVITNIKSTGDFDNIGEYSEGSTVFQNEYMCYETGVGSGTVWKESLLFESKELAESECEKLNGLK